MNQDALAPYYADLARMSFSPGWARPAPSIWPAPQPKFKPAVWRLVAAKAALDQAGDFVPVEQAERRNLIMVNPIEGNTYATTRNIVAAYQMVKAGETARSHRHSPAALRLVVAAKPGTYTVVNGARIDMLPGDVVLTPSWSWHGHVNESDATSYWIDFLDVPFVQHAEAMFFEHHPEGLVTVTSTGPTPMRFPAGDPLGSGKEAKIAEIAKDVLPTFGLHFVRLPASTRADVAKTTTNYVYSPVRGAVRFTAEDGTDETVGPGDVIAMPCWHAHSYQAETDAVIFRVSDEPLLAKLGLTRTQPE
ncbi:MAG: cupin domain-containing protein [Rhizobiales bacterium]|nr:cupin domain-containing protein [Hyphomicrobiales bacterium]